LRTFTCQGLARLRDLDKRQEIAERRRLFYVAGTRASERLILAGRATKRKLVSWQGWFEEALELGENHRQAGLWRHPKHNWQLNISGASKTQAPLAQAAEKPGAAEIDIEPIVERSQSVLMAATLIAGLRERFNTDSESWWMCQHLRIDPAPKRAQELWSPAASTTARARGALLGQLVHRLLMAGTEVLESSQSELEEHALNLAKALTETSHREAEGDEPSVSELECLGLARSACAILARFQQSDAAAQAIARLIQAPGKSEVPFALALGRWIVRGRFDKLMPVEGADGFTLLDWKTGRTGDAAEAKERYRKQMELYALALARSGCAARINGCVQTQLVVFESAEIITLQFDDATLQAFGSELENDLRESDRYCESLAVAGQALPRRSVGG
jgi:ATP-dependent exoDNAse (exonuclease V) beta subunit